MAEALGDPTARYAGRLTLNPLKHIDLVGSIIVPIVLSLIPPYIVFGWAKPVPVNPYNLKNQRWGELLVAAAGPLSNIAIAVFFGLMIRFGFMFPFLPISFWVIARSLVFINLLLAIFNLVPIPPLDGSKIFFGLLSYRFIWIKDMLERHSWVFFFIFIIFLWQFLDPLIYFLFKLVTGFQG
jgi:Zn-dependent protease